MHLPDRGQAAASRRRAAGSPDANSARERDTGERRDAGAECQLRCPVPFASGAAPSSSATAMSARGGRAWSAAGVRTPCPARPCRCDLRRRRPLAERRAVIAVMRHRRRGVGGIGVRTPCPARPCRCDCGGDGRLRNAGDVRCPHGGEGVVGPGVRTPCPARPCRCEFGGDGRSRNGGGWRSCGAGGGAWAGRGPDTVSGEAVPVRLRRRRPLANGGAMAVMRRRRRGVGGVRTPCPARPCRHAATATAARGTATMAVVRRRR